MSALLPEGVFHLLVADDAVRFYGIYMTVCGEDVPASELPSCYSEEKAIDAAYADSCGLRWRRPLPVRESLGLFLAGDERVTA